MSTGRPIYTFRGFRWRGWFGILLLVPVVGLVLVSRPAVPFPPAVNLAIRLLGWTTFVLGAAFRLWSMLYLGGRKSKVAVTEGPYSIVRHPLYVGSFLIAVSAALFLASAVALGAVVIVAAGYACFTVRAEERLLSETLGDPYVEYSKRTRRFLPRLVDFKASPTVEVEGRALRNELRRAWGWILLPWPADVVSHLRAEPRWPRLLDLP